MRGRFAEILNEPCVGWKVGAAVPAVQIMEGHDGPIVGRLFSHRQYISLDAKIYSEQGISESIQTFSNEFFRDPVDVPSGCVNG